MVKRAVFCVGAKEFSRTLRQAGADMEDLKNVNRQAANIVLPAARSIAPHGSSGKLVGSMRVGASKKAGFIRAGGTRVKYAGVINYGWPKRGIKPHLFMNRAIASTENAWLQLYDDFVEETMKQVKGK